MNQYAYDGPVMEFDTCVASRWKGSTYAESESKARSNLAYQYKKKHKTEFRVRKLRFPERLLW